MLQVFRIFIFSLLLFNGPIVCRSQSTEVGKPFPPWKEGDLEIHAIYTGRGESTFFILPDGTSLLLDAGDWDPSDYPLMMQELPNTSKRAGEWIADYIKKVNPHKKHVDYLMVSHFHSDHIGSGTKGAGYTKNRSPNYELSGISQVGEYIHFNTAIDRANPTYDYPVPLRSNKDLDNYTNFLKWKTYTDSLKVEKFKIGSKKQIVLKKDPDKFQNFDVFNLFSNGMVWDSKKNRIDTVYKYKYQYGSFNENSMSIGMKISYGSFSYYTGGDLSGEVLDSLGQLIDIQKIFAKMCGPVDVAKANHHGYLSSMTAGFIKYIQAHAYIAEVWDYQHIQPDVISRMAKETKDGVRPSIFFTWFPQPLIKRYSEKPWMNQVVSDGHVIVKAYDKGKKYKIYLINARNQKMIVKAVYGPFESE